MTREEAIEVIEQDIPCELDTDLIEALEMAIKALEQMPVTTTAGEGGVIYYPQVEGVTPTVIDAGKQEPKTGHWIDDNENEIDAQYGRHLYKCSECNEYADMFVGGTEDWWDLEKPNYCPNCGAKMVEPQERSDKE